MHASSNQRVIKWCRLPKGSQEKKMIEGDSLYVENITGDDNDSLFLA